MSILTGLDFGGYGTEICTADGGIVLRQPSLAAVDAEGNVVAVGTEAYLTAGRTPGSVTVRRPIRDSVVGDFNLTAELLDRLLETAVPKKRKRVLAAVRCGVGAENRALIKNALLDCRVSKVDFIDAPFAAFEGFYKSDDKKLSESNGILLCDIGGGSVECAFVRGGEILRSETYFGGGSDSDNTICVYLRRHYGLAVTKQEAEAAKLKLDLTVPEQPPFVMCGLDTSTGLPKRLEIPASDILKCSAPSVKGAADCIRTVLTNLPRFAGKPTEADRILLMGGGANLPGIDGYIAAELDTEIPVEVAEEPSDCVVRGLNRIISREK